MPERDPNRIPIDASGPEIPFARRTGPKRVKAPTEDVDLERAVVGSCLIGIEHWIDTARTILTPDAFTDNRWAVAFETIGELRDKRLGVDLITVSAALAERHTSSSPFSSYHLADATSHAATNLEDACWRLLDRYERRSVTQAAQRILRVAEDGEVDAGGLRELAAKHLEVGRPLGSLRRVRNLSSAIETVEAQLAEAAATEGLLGIPTGSAQLDAIIKGLRRGKYHIVAGASGSGKSIVGLKLARAAAFRGDSKGPVPTAYFSTEMPAADLLKRIEVAECRIDSEAYKAGQLTDADQERLAAFRVRLRESRLYVSDVRGMKAVDVLGDARRMIRQFGVRLIIVDYLQRLDPAGLSSDGYEREVAAMSKAFADLAVEEDVAVVALSQITRKKSEEGTEPTINDLRGSGDMENDADVVVLIYRQAVHGIEYDAKETDGPTEHLVKLIVGKQRDGKRGRVMATWLGEYQDIRDGKPARDVWQSSLGDDLAPDDEAPF